MTSTSTSTTATPVILFGASRGTGFELAHVLRERGIPVIAMLRGETGQAELTDLGVQLLRGDAMHPADIQAALDLAKRRDPAGYRIISTLGGSGIDADGRSVDEHGNIHLIDAACAQPPTRFVLITAIGCGEMLPHRTPGAIAAFGPIVEAKTRAEAHLRASPLPWSIIRPGGLRSEPATGQGQLTSDPEIHGFIHRADLARLTERVLRDPNTIGTALAAVDANQCHGPHPLEPFPLAP